MFQFSEGTVVAIKKDNDALGLAAGDTGTVWMQYNIQPPAYEVAFRTQSGEEFDALMYESELTALATLERQEHSLAA